MAILTIPGPGSVKNGRNSKIGQKWVLENLLKNTLEKVVFRKIGPFWEFGCTKSIWSNVNMGLDSHKGKWRF